MNNSSYKVAACQFIVLLCNRMLGIAITWHIVSKSGNDALASYISISLLPFILGLFISPVIIRKFGAINIVTFADAFNALLYGVALLAIFYDAHFIDNNVLLVMAIIANMASSLFAPAAMSLPYILVTEEHLQKFVSLLQMSASISSLIGAPLGVIAYNHLGLNGLFVVAVLVYAVSALIQKTIRQTQNPFSSQNPEDEKKIIYSPITFVKKYKFSATMIILYTLASMFVAPMAIFIPIFTIDVFHTDAYGLSLLEAAFGVGSIAGGLFLLRFPLNEIPIWKIIFGSNLASGVCYLVFAMNSHFVGGQCVLFALGFFAMIEGVFLFKLIQMTTEIVDIPFTMALASFMTVIAAPLGIFFASMAGKAMHVQHSASLFALLTVFLSIGFFYVLRGFKPKQSLATEQT